MNTKDLAVMPYKHYKSICDAIRDKRGEEERYTIVSGQLAEEIEKIGGGADVSMVTATADDVLEGKTFVSADGELIDGEMKNNGTANYTISTKTAAVAPAKGYHSGSGKVSIATAEQNKIVAGNIRKGVTMLGVAGSAEAYNFYRSSGSSSRFLGVTTPSKATKVFAFPTSLRGQTTSNITIYLGNTAYQWNTYSGLTKSSITIAYNGGESHVTTPTDSTYVEEYYTQYIV